MDIEKVKKEAREEIREEKHREAVEACKDKLRKKRKLIDVLFPWKITIERKNK